MGEGEKEYCGKKILSIYSLSIDENISFLRIFIQHIHIVYIRSLIRNVEHGQAIYCELALFVLSSQYFNQGEKISNGSCSSNGIYIYRKGYRVIPGIFNQDMNTSHSMKQMEIQL